MANGITSSGHAHGVTIRIPIAGYGAVALTVPPDVARDIAARLTSHALTAERFRRGDASAAMQCDDETPSERSTRERNAEPVYLVVDRDAEPDCAVLDAYARSVPGSLADSLARADEHKAAGRDCVEVWEHPCAAPRPCDVDEAISAWEAR